MDPMVITIFSCFFESVYENYKTNFLENYYLYINFEYRVTAAVLHVTQFYVRNKVFEFLAIFTNFFFEK